MLYDTLTASFGNDCHHFDIFFDTYVSQVLLALHFARRMYFN